MSYLQILLTFQIHEILPILQISCLPGCVPCFRVVCFCCRFALAVCGVLSRELCLRACLFGVLLVSHCRIVRFVNVLFYWFVPRSSCSVSR